MLSLSIYTHGSYPIPAVNAAITAQNTCVQAIRDSSYQLRQIASLFWITLRQTNESGIKIVFLHTRMHQMKKISPAGTRKKNESDIPHAGYQFFGSLHSIAIRRLVSIARIGKRISSTPFSKDAFASSGFTACGRGTTRD